MSEAGTGDADIGQLLGIFSAEVWLHILENVKDAADFQRISDASPYLGTLLRPRATQALFPEVLKIMVEQQQPPLFASPVELLPMRQVCKAWASGVEQALEDPEYPFLFEREQWEKCYLMKGQPTYVNSDDNSNFYVYKIFGDKEDYAKFLQHFGATQSASATGKSSLFFCQDVMFFIVRLQDHFPHCLEFLQTYGSHIWHLDLQLDPIDAEQHGQFYNSDRLQRILELMPNLKSLDFADLRLGYQDLEDPYPPRRRYSVELPVAVSPVPELKQLQMMSVEGLPLSFLRALVQSNPQVSIVSDRSTAPKENHLPLYLEQMPNLTALQLKLNTQVEFEAFRRASVNCQLSKLHLSIKWGRDEDYLWRFAEVAIPLFRVLEESRFSATLTELDLKFRCPPDDSEEQGLQLQLPQLKKLTVTFRDYLIPLDFVLPLKDSLEELGVEVQMDYYRPTRPPFEIDKAMEGDKAVKLYQFWREPEKSNVWTLFPKLKALRIKENEEMYSCTREQWVAQQSSN